MLEIARVALDDLALLGDGNFEKGLAVIHRAPGIGDEAMGGAVAGMDVRVYEARRDQHPRCIDDLVDTAVESLADEEDLVVLVDELAVPQERVLAALMGHDPGCLDLGAHLSVTAA